MNHMQKLPTWGAFGLEKRRRGGGTVCTELGSPCAARPAFLSTSERGERTEGGSRRRSARQEKTACLVRTAPERLSG